MKAKRTTVPKAPESGKQVTPKKGARTVPAVKETPLQAIQKSLPSDEELISKLEKSVATDQKTLSTRAKEAEEEWVNTLPTKVNGAKTAIGSKVWICRSRVIDNDAKDSDERPCEVSEATVIGIDTQDHHLVLDDGRMSTLGPVYYEWESLSLYLFSTEEGAKKGVEKEEERTVLPWARHRIAHARLMASALDPKTGATFLATAPMRVVRSVCTALGLPAKEHGPAVAAILATPLAKRETVLAIHRATIKRLTERWDTKLDPEVVE